MNYLDIFPDEFSRRPTQKKIDHAIELVPRVAPIAKAPYIYSLKKY